MYITRLSGYMLHTYIHVGYAYQSCDYLNLLTAKGFLFFKCFRIKEPSIPVILKDLKKNLWFYGRSFDFFPKKLGTMIVYQNLVFEKNKFGNHGYES
jgi:hypothetical protein